MADMGSSSSMEHSLHPDHPLTRVHRAHSFFICDACHTRGSGSRYRCEPCDFNLHLYCALGPSTVLSRLHPSHPLSLQLKHCDHCRRHVRGIFYRCHDCDFHLHPLCLARHDSQAKTKLPSTIVRHPSHFLKLKGVAGDFTCGACKENGTGRRYRCEEKDCRFQLHVFCVTCPHVSQSSLHPQHEMKLCRKHCDECGKEVEGTFYRCQQGCDFDLHPLCLQKAIVTTAPTPSPPPPVAVERPRTSVYFFMHPQHEVEGGEVRERGWCEVCGGAVDGYGWSCTRCRFYVHDGCRRVRPVVREAAHRSHSLHYLRSKVRACAVCGENCIKWRYHCDLCDVHIHRRCLKRGPSVPAAIID